jgi:hypothetical protein
MMSPHTSAPPRRLFSEGTLGVVLRGGAFAWRRLKVEGSPPGRYLSRLTLSPLRRDGYIPGQIRGPTRH